jgi:hypothetical protein
MRYRTVPVGMGSASVASGLDWGGVMPLLSFYGMRDKEIVDALLILERVWVEIEREQLEKAARNT